jgi:putative aldouronate transport system permease protein
VSGGTSTLKEKGQPQADSLAALLSGRRARAFGDGGPPLRVRHRTFSYHVMLFPVVAFLCVFSLYPLAGSVLAFKTYQASKGIWGSPWAGLDNFTIVFSTPHFYAILRNTIVISLAKILLNLVVPLAFALLLNEVRLSGFKRGVQTITYLPYFLSWVILAGVFKDLFSTTGMVNKLLEALFGVQPVMFFASVTAFPIIVVLTDTWKDFGFNAILYLAALAAIDPGLYEAARIDGASRWKQLLHVTLPGITATIVLLAALSLQNVLNAGFEQILNLYNPLVYDTGDIRDTYVYRMGLIDSQFEVATAIGLLKSTVGFCLIYTANALAGRYANYKIF